MARARIWRWLPRPWPRSLAGQLIVGLLLALVVAHVLIVFAFMDERHHAMRGAQQDGVLASVAILVRALDATDDTAHGQILRAANGPHARYEIAAASAAGGAPRDHVERKLARRLRAHLGGTAPRSVEVMLRADDDAWPPLREEEDDDDHDDDDWHDRRNGEDEAWRPRRWRRPVSLTLSVALDDGRWLNGHVRVPPHRPGWAAPGLIALAVSALGICLVVIFAVRRTTRPLRALAGAAEAFGRGESVGPLPERGTIEVRRTTRAFNQMQARITRFVDDRMRMLAAISHDLRTPLTSLRLRAEMLDDTETRDKMLATLDELQRMVEATLAFVREEAAQEESRTIDLVALIESIVADLADTGHNARFSGPARLAFTGRPAALKRALRNLIDNAVAYGKRADVALTQRDDAIVITIDDLGPGIRPEDQERVFEPFVRLDASRSRETGGIGLGLAIARTILRGHGGDLTLQNRAEGGLRVTVTLPR